MKYICAGEPYEKDGEKKMKWYRLGEIFKAKNGKIYAKLYHMPGQLLHVFDSEKKQKTEPPKYDEYGADMEVPF